MPLFTRCLLLVQVPRMRSCPHSSHHSSHRSSLGACRHPHRHQPRGRLPQAPPQVCCKTRLRRTSVTVTQGQVLSVGSSWALLQLRPLLRISGMYHLGLRVSLSVRMVVSLVSVCLCEGGVRSRVALVLPHTAVQLHIPLPLPLTLRRPCPCPGPCPMLGPGHCHCGHAAGAL